MAAFISLLPIQKDRFGMAKSKCPSEDWQHLSYLVLPRVHTSCSVHAFVCVRVFVCFGFHEYLHVVFCSCEDVRIFGSGDYFLPCPSHLLFISMWYYWFISMWYYYHIREKKNKSNCRPSYFYILYSRIVQPFQTKCFLEGECGMCCVWHHFTLLPVVLAGNLQISH